MWLKVMDNKPYFATHFIHVEVTDEVRERINLQVEETGVVCYSVDELNKTVQTLDELNLVYTVEDLNPDPVLIAKTEGISYMTPEEVKQHILEDKEPESLTIPNLRKQLKDAQGLIVQLQNDNKLLKSRLKATEDALLGVMFKGVAK